MRIIDKNDQPIRFDLTPEGYLIKRAHIARTGPMDYSGDELDMAPGVYQVYTEASELFSAGTIATYEGVPVTMLHPDGLVVNSENWRDVSIGYIRNVAPNPDGIHLDADIVINDASAITLISKHGIRELSCGQDADVVEGPDGKLYKKDVRGNHVAVVPSARAGNDHRLGDRKMTMAKKKHSSLIDSLMKVIGLGKKMGDSEMSPEDKAALEAAIAELQAALDALPVDALPEEVEALKAQIAELQAKLDGMTAVADKKTGDASDEEVAALKEKIAALEAENEELKKENEGLKSSTEKDKAVADAAARFPAVKLGDAKNARAVHVAVLADAKAFADAQMEGMSDSEIKAAYTALCVTQSQKPTVGKKLLGDAKKEKVNLTKKFGGKKNGK